MRLLLAAALATLAGLALPAHADPPKTAPPDVHAMHTDDCARARAQHRTCVLDMGADQITGNAPTAGGSTVRVVQPVKEPSLIQPRREFIEKILLSAEDL